jgi:hypothetical protein
MDAEHAEALAAIGLAAPTGDASPAREIGDDGDLLAGPEEAASADLVDLASQFMPDDSGVFEIGLRAFENMQIRPANASAAQADQHVTRAGRRLRALDDLESSGTSAKQRSHLSRSLPSTRGGAISSSARALQSTGPDINASSRKNLCCWSTKGNAVLQVNMFFMQKKLSMKTGARGAAGRVFSKRRRR